MPIYKLEFLPSAIKDWKKLDSAIRSQFEKKLVERLSQPRIASARLRDLPDSYKIKLRKAGYRLVYRVVDERIVVIVIAVGKRENNNAYEKAKRRS